MAQFIFKRIAVFAFGVLLVLPVLAQQSHFLYMQTENGQPFYIKINNKVISSSPAGYLIVPKLADGEVKLNIGFPKKEFPEENFQIVINKKNEGFLLKNFGEKGWGLFNMQTYGVIMGGNNIVAPAAVKTFQDDQFSQMLANVVKDSLILQKNDVIKDTLQQVAKADSVVAIAEKPVTMLVLPAKRILSKKNKDGLQLVYVDLNDHLNDTIRIFLPVVKAIVKSGRRDTSVAQQAKPEVKEVAKKETLPPVVLPVDSTRTATQEVTPATAPAVVQTGEQVVPKIGEQPAAPVMPSDTIVEQPSQMEPVRDSTLSKKTKESKPELKVAENSISDTSASATSKPATSQKQDIVVLPKVVQSSTSNSDCKAFAANEDFLKLRKKMASGTSDDNMITIAKKTFHSKCFSTEQIKNLSFLFLTNDGKYKFFDMAYPFASDAEQYTILESQLTDAYYINRFKAMIHK